MDLSYPFPHTFQIHRLSPRLRAGLTAFLLLLNWSPRAMAQEHPHDAQRLLFQARAAMEDGLPPLAERIAREVYANDSVPEAVRRDALDLVFHAMLAAHEPERLLLALQPGAINGRPLPQDGWTDLWQARALLAMERPEEAVEVLRKALPDASPTMSSRIRLEIPAALLAAGNAAAGLEAFEALDRTDLTPSEQARISLDHAQLLFDLKRPREAEQRLVELLESIAQDTGTAPFLDAARLQLARLRLERNDPAAETLLRTLAESPETDLDQRAAAQVGLAILAEHRGDVQEAVTAAGEAVLLAQSPSMAFDAQAALARLLCRIEQPAQAVEPLRQALRIRPRDPQSFALQLDVADAFFRARAYERALQKIQAVLESTTQPDIELRAQRARGEALWTLGRPAEAAVAFLRVVDLAPDSESREQHLLRAAEAQRDADSHAQAIETLARFQAIFPDSSHLAHASLLRGESLATLSPTEAERHFLTLSETFPETPEGATALFRAAELAALRDDLSTAIERYDLAASRSAADSKLQAVCHVGRGLLHFRSFHFDLALADFNRAAELGGAAGEQAAYLRAAALYNMGLEEDALSACLNFLDQRPDSAWAPDVTYWLGHYYFNRQQYEDAKRYFHHLTEQWPTRPECDSAWLWIARCRFAMQRFGEASAAALRLIRDYPSSPLLAEARLIHGESLCEQMRFDEAILVFDELLALHPDSPWAAQALGRKGDSLFTLGSDDEMRYQESIVAYRTLLARSGLPLDMQLQAAYKIGRGLERSGQPDEAREQYYRGVVLRYFEAREAGVWPNDRARAWFSRGALSAADMFEKKEEWSVALSVLRRMAREDVPNRAEAEERARRIQQTRSVTR